MFRRFLKPAVGILLKVLCVALLLIEPVAAQKKDKLSLDQIPMGVMDGLKARFPKAEIHKCTKEQEGDVVVYDFEFKQEGRKFEADIREDGTIHNWERAVTVESLPDAVRQVVREKYPESTFKEITEITNVKNGKDELEGYEIVLETADKKVVEITVAPDGKILDQSEDSDVDP